jgi:hypothetical protein
MCESDVIEVFGDTGCEAHSAPAKEFAERSDNRDVIMQRLEE